MIFYITFDEQTGDILKVVQSNEIPIASNIISIDASIHNNASKKYKVNLVSKSLEVRNDYGYIEDPIGSGIAREMTPQEKVDNGLESVDQYRQPVILKIVSEMNDREKPLIDKYSNGQKLSFPTRKEESRSWLALPTADRTIAYSQSNYSLLYRIVTIENGIINPTVDDITNEALSIQNKVIIFEDSLSALSKIKDVLIGKDAVLDPVTQTVITPASGVYALTVDELINYDVKARWDAV